jgi:transcriptional regulator with XRE-family HTH domain
VARLSIALAAAIRRRRLAAGISQEELADRAHLHRTYISLVERAKRNLTVDALDRLAAGLGVLGSTLVAEAERARSVPRR